MASSVFISWSGTVGRQVALALDEFLPVFIHSVEPWVSPVAISVGQRWLTELAQVLDACDFGIICITPDSLHSAWLLFEAGALGKKFADSRVCPILVGVERHELPDCINQFQSVSADRAGLFQLVTSLKKCLGPPRLSDQQLERNFNAFWPLLEERLALASEQLAEQRESRISVIHGALQRTKQIVADLEFLRDSRSAFGEAKIVRYSGFLSTFAFSKEEFDRWRDEMRAEKLVNPRSTGLEYIDALQDEHDRMLDIAKQEHCLIKCVITPPTLNWQSTDPESAAAAEQSKQRLNRLKEFLEGSDDALNNIEWAISPYLQPNTHIIGNASCLQGFKRGKQRGYDFTLRYAGAEEVASNCLMYDELFEHLATWTLTTYRVVPQHDRREALRLATLACIKEELGEANHPPDEEKPK